MVTLDRDEDGVWVAECPAIPGSVSQGESREAVLANVKEAIAVVKAFQRDGGQKVRQRGSHIILVKHNHPATLSGPLTRKLPKAPCAVSSAPLATARPTGLRCPGNHAGALCPP